MDKKEASKILSEISVILEIKGENPFKCRAYENAARIIEGLPQDLKSLVESGELAKIKGIGSGLNEKITELVTTGKMSYYEDLKSTIPPGVLDMITIPGLGPKRVKAVWDKLGITTIGELEYACIENRLVDLEGFGQKYQEKILQGIELLKKFSERHLYDFASLEASLIYSEIKDDTRIHRSSVTGSLRRRCETVKDIDIVACVMDEHRQGIMDKFTGSTRVEQVTAKGETKSSVILKSGINCDLRIITEAEFPFALHHFTGSKEHNTALRVLAKQMHMKMNEYGIFTNGGRIDCKDEEEIFAALGLSFIPPELRENYGEIEAAQTGSLPLLVKDEDIKGIIHVHSNFSDGSAPIETLTRYCISRGYEYLGIADHSKSARYASGLSEEEIR
ncbi:MAG: helix-hairpin-helix domain-containing protein, partial [Fidelibacterota bacterium]